jgi:hypothetical protein
MRKYIQAIIILVIFCSFDGIYYDEEGITYVYEGRYGSTVGYRIKDNYVYTGRWDNDIIYRIEDNYVYHGR